MAKAAKESIFLWEGTTRQGTKIKGQMSAQDPSLIKAQLRKQGINPTRVRKQGIQLFSSGKRIKPMDIAIFTRQLATMMKSGVPLLQSFDIIIDGLASANMTKLVQSIKADVGSGNSLASALRKHPQYFDDLYC